MSDFDLSTIAAEDIIAEHPSNEFIFHESIPQQKRNHFQCSGPFGYCPHQLPRVKKNNVIKRIGIIPYFNWLGESWLLLRIRNGIFDVFAISDSFSNYYNQRYGLMDNKLMIGPKLLIRSKKHRATIFVEYKEFPPNLVAAQKRLALTQDELAIIQYSYFRSNLDDFPLSQMLETTVAYLPASL
jgi:hypothetical protein